MLSNASKSPEGTRHQSARAAAMRRLCGVDSCELFKHGPVPRERRIRGRPVGDPTSSPLADCCLAAGYTQESSAESLAQIAAPSVAENVVRNLLSRGSYLILPAFSRFF